MRTPCFTTAGVFFYPSLPTEHACEPAARGPAPHPCAVRRKGPCQRFPRLCTASLIPAFHMTCHTHTARRDTDMPGDAGEDGGPAAVARDVPRPVAVCEHGPLPQLARVLCGAHAHPARLGHGRAGRLPRRDVPRAHGLHHGPAAVPLAPRDGRRRPHRAHLARTPRLCRERHRLLPEKHTPHGWMEQQQHNNSHFRGRTRRCTCWRGTRTR